MQVNLSKLPNPAKTYLVDFPKLYGGLNIQELDYRLPSNQSPEMKNLWWQDGVLQSRDGQAYVSSQDDLGAGYTCFNSLFCGYAFFHIGAKLYCSDLTIVSPATSVTMCDICDNVPENRGTFFRYEDCLFYKNNGGFYKIEYNPDASFHFRVRKVEDDAYTPVIIMNAAPASGAGDEYQPENRLSAKKTVKYSGDGSSTEYILPVTDITSIDEVIVDGAELFAAASAVREYDKTANNILKIATKATAVTKLEYRATTYTNYRPVETWTEIAAADYTVDITNHKITITGSSAQGKEKYRATLTVPVEYSVTLSDSKVTFTTAPSTEASNVAITYTKANTDAFNSVMDCIYAMPAGDGKNLCVLMAGASKQTNAVFWNSNDNVAMNIGYWPMDYYNLVGDVEDPVTGFGMQYNDVIVFQSRSVGKLNFSIEEITTVGSEVSRDAISFGYERINSKVGCDLPWTIQLIENNLVFCNTYQGVHIVGSSSAAKENNIDCISKNINGTDQKNGLLYAIQHAEGPVTSFDDDKYYWIAVDGKVFLWNYEISSYSDPSWFYFTNIGAVSFFMDDENKLYHLNATGRVSKFERLFSDYNAAIDKVYQFPPQHFETYDTYKDVLRVIFTTRGDTDSYTTIKYQCDYGDWTDQTPINMSTWHLVPRNLTYRTFNVLRYAVVAKRNPGLKHIRHFGMRLENNVVGNDLAIVSAQIYYRYSGKER